VVGGRVRFRELRLGPLSRAIVTRHPSRSRLGSRPARLRESSSFDRKRRAERIRRASSRSPEFSAGARLGRCAWVRVSLPRESVGGRGRTARSPLRRVTSRAGEPCRSPAGRGPTAIVAPGPRLPGSRASRSSSEVGPAAFPRGSPTGCRPCRDGLGAGGVGALRVGTVAAQARPAAVERATGSTPSRASARCHLLSSSPPKTSSSSAGATSQPFAWISASSWPGAQPE